MTSCEEFFCRLRKLASSVNRESNELMAILEDSESTLYNENRAWLLLRETLAEVKDLKTEINAKFEEAKQGPSFGDFVSTCAHFVTQRKQQITDLETHLEKYGYVKPAEELPQLKYPVKHDDGQSEETSVAMEVAETCSAVTSEFSNSRNHNALEMALEGNTDTEQDISMEGEHRVLSNDREIAEDFLKSPVPPTTFTKMIEITPQRPFSIQEGFQEWGQQNTPVGTPVPPQTTTPMIKTKPVLASLDAPNSNESTPLEAHFPTQPVTVTPMIKPCENRMSDATKSSESLSPQFASPTLPAPPAMGTPGLKTLAPSGLGGSSPELPFNLDNLPSPPEITSVILLKPDDVTAPVTNYKQPGCITVHALNQEEYKILPVYVTNQFSLERINHHIHTINSFLTSNSSDTSPPLMQEQDLRYLLGLGPATKSFMLALNKTGRLKISGGSITFLGSS